MSKHPFFTKRAILIEFATAAFALFLLLYVMVPKYIQQQSETYAVKQIEGIGGMVRYDDNQNLFKVNLAYRIDDNGKRIDVHHHAKRIIEILPTLPHLTHLMMYNDQSTDMAMEHIGKIETLKRLYMWDAEVTDAGITHISNAKNLQFILCTNANLTDHSLKTLSSLPNLTEMILQGNNFSDKGLEYIKHHNCPSITN